MLQKTIINGTEALGSRIDVNRGLLGVIGLTSMKMTNLTITTGIFGIWGGVRTHNTLSLWFGRLLQVALTFEILQVELDSHTACIMSNASSVIINGTNGEPDLQVDGLLFLSESNLAIFAKGVCYRFGHQESLCSSPHILL